MDQTAQGIATAAFTLISVLLQALVHKGVLSREDALGIVDRSLEAAANAASAEEAGEVVEVTQHCLAGVREGLLGMGARR